MLPLAFTLKLVVDINLSLPLAAPLIKKLEPLREWSSEENPPINPALAVIVPIKVAPLAIKIPSLSTIKLGPILIKKLDEFEPVGVKSI